jgi:transposase
MYIKRTTKFYKGGAEKGKQYSSYFLVEKQKCPNTNKFKERILLNLSPKFSVPEKLWRALCRKIEYLLNPRPLRSIFSENTETDQYLDDWASKIVQKLNDKKSSESVPSRTPDEEVINPKDYIAISAKSVGGENLALKAINDLNIPEIFKELTFTSKQIKLAIAQIMARMLHPSSEEGTSKWLAKDSFTLNLINLDETDCYPMALHRVSDKLIENKKAIEDRLFNNSSLFSSTKVLLFLDLTNTFFEGKAETISKAHRGFSKEKRFDCPLLSIALCIDQQGYIIQSQILPGNVSEPTTLPGFMELTLARPGDLVVMDKGIATKDNLEWLDNHDFKYVVADRRLKREFDPELASEFDTASGSKIRAYRVNDETCPRQVKLLCHSEDRQAKEIAMIKKNSEKLVEQLTKINLGLAKPRTIKDVDKINRRIGRLLERYSVAGKYYDITVETDESNPKIAVAVKFEWNEIKGSKSELPGVYSLLTNDTSMSDEEILKTYLHLTDVESVFKTLKSELGLRPNYHKTERRVDGHMFISLLAYQVVNYIRNALKKKGIHDSWNTIRNTAGEQKMVEHICKPLGSKKALIVTSCTCLTDTMINYNDAMNISKEYMKPTYKYVDKWVWNYYKKRNY